jgi:hypothetical protein
LGRGRLPHGGTFRRIDHDRLPGLENLFDAGQYLQAQRAKFRPPGVDGSEALRTPNAVRHRTWTRYLQRMAGGGMEIEFQHGYPLETYLVHIAYKIYQQFFAK